MLARKLISAILVVLGGVSSSFAFLLGYAAIGGGYYPKPADGTFGHLLGALMVAMWRDWSIAMFFWVGATLIAAGFIVLMTMKVR